MGYNRSGTRRKQRLKRHKREITRLVAKMEAAESGAAAPATGEKAATKK